MNAEKENFTKLNYRIKLVADNNVVLVEAENYELEIFTPQILNGRIILSNIIPNRRCCQVTKTNITKYAKNEPKVTNSFDTQNALIRKNSRIKSMDQIHSMRTPLASSTPASVNQRSRCDNILSKSTAYVRSTDSIVATPEPVRRQVTARPKILEKTMLNLPEDVMIARIYHSPMQGPSKKLGRIVTAANSISCIQKRSDVSVLNGSYTLPCSPAISSKNWNFGASTCVDSIASWQKVLTPVRTYTKKSEKPVMVRRPVSVQSAKKASRSFKFTPTYLVNPTQAPKVAQLIEIKKRKLIVDRKISISPKSFKKQQKEPFGINTKNSIASQTKSLSFHKPRLYVESMAMSAFDLLTNSNHSSCIAINLNKQFRSRCINKTSSTYFKYKVLSTVPPLQQDEQILELSSISLQTSNSAQDMI